VTVPATRDTADLVAAAVLACPAVAGLVDDTVATFLPGRRVGGVRVEDDVCLVSVALRLDGRPLPELADEVRRAAATAAGDRRIDVLVADVGTADDGDADADADVEADADADDRRPDGPA
jgi:hypothetical protein